MEILILFSETQLPFQQVFQCYAHLVACWLCSVERHACDKKATGGSAGSRKLDAVLAAKLVHCREGALSEPHSYVCTTHSYGKIKA